MARDPGILYRWAIVKLEDDFLPYLAPIGDILDELIRLEVVTAEKGHFIRTAYNYRQQQGKAETGTSMTVRFVPSSKTNSGPADVQTLYEGPVRSEIRLPVRISGFVYVSVTPQSASRAGKTYFSSPVRIGKSRQ